MAEQFKAWISQDALSDGVYEIDARECLDNISSIMRLGGWYPEYFHGDDWHRTRESAVAKAEEMREETIKSLQEEIERLKKVKF
jgi:hypothetical protein